MFQFRAPRMSCLLIFAAALVTGCNGTGDNLPGANVRIGVGASASASGLGAVVPFDFGSIAVLTSKTQVFTVFNTGDMDATLQGVTSADLTLSAPFAAKDTLAAQAGIQPCTAGMTLTAGGGACLVTVEYNPVTVGNFNTTLTFTYATKFGVSSTDPVTSKAVSLMLLGESHLDCNVYPEMNAAQGQGVQAAKDQMAKDAIRGTKDGQALTYEGGKNDGQSKGHSDGYNIGYHSAAGYDAGYNFGYSDGLNRGLTDPATCSKGQNAGINAGVAAGGHDGNYDGYNDGYSDGIVGGGGNGYSDGYNAGQYVGASDASYSGANDGAAAGHYDGYGAGYSDGQSVGYNDGYADGSMASCPGAADSGNNSGNSQARLSPADPAAAFVQACYNQGYNGTYSSSAYTNAYEAAKAANVQYQSGYHDGYDAGKAAGIAAGKTQGYADGQAQGEGDGFAAGTASEYTQCYNSAYTSSYAAAYKNSYNAAYPSGLNTGVNDAYTAAYNSGYADGYNVGYNNNYTPAYNADYSAAYSDSYSSGYTDGYNSGYDSGYSDGESAQCGGMSAQAMISLPSRTARARALRTVKIPTPVVPVQNVSKVRKPIGKLPVGGAHVPSYQYGVGQAWWMTDGGVGVSTFVGSNLPKSVEFECTDEQKAAFHSLRDASVEGSLRRFLKAQNAARPLGVKLPK
ncbi:hypothetical protein WDW37_20625 [Bdellovibrionota bacterium FG-1]